MALTNLPCLALDVVALFLILAADSLTHHLFHTGLYVLEGDNNSRACSAQVKRKSGHKIP